MIWKEAILTGQQTAFMESGVLTMYPDTGAFCQTQERADKMKWHSGKV